MRNRRIAIAEFFAFFGCRTMPGPGALSGGVATASCTTSTASPTTARSLRSWWAGAARAKAGGTP
jgi:hypothetical protein